MNPTDDHIPSGAATADPTTTDERVLTRALAPAPGCALDPCVEEASWIAWRLESASPNQIVSESSVHAAESLFDRILEMSWLPGRVAAVSEVALDFDDGHPRLDAHLALAVLGPLGTTAEEASALADLVHRRIHGAGLPYRAAPVDAAAVLDLPPEQLAHAALVRQRTVSIGADPDDADVEVLSRWNPVVSPWVSITTALLTRRAPTRVRATVLPTEQSIADRLELESGLQRAETLREASERRRGRRFHAERAIATLVDLQASFSTPVLCVEIAVLSSAPLPELFLRDIGSCLTSETDVLRRSGHTVVAGQQLMLGGFDLERNPAGLAQAVGCGLPLRGGMGRRSLADLITLSESPIGWPVPINGPVPTIASGTMRDLPAPAALRTGVPIGDGAGGLRVHLPDAALARHLFVTGATGTGKSTVLCAGAVDDLRAGRGFLFVDLHGEAADRIVAVADSLGRPVVSLDAGDADTALLQLLPALDPNGGNRAQAERAATRMCDALVAALPSKDWAGPRWYQLAQATLMLCMAHRVPLAEAVGWVDNYEQLRERLRHQALSAKEVSLLNGLHSARLQDAVGTRDWMTSKFGPVTSSNAARVVAGAGLGRAIPALLADEIPIVVNLSALAGSEASLVGHLMLSAVLDAAMDRPREQRPPFRAYVDEAQRFVVSGMRRVQTEGRKFGVSLALATQSLRQLDPVLADIATSAAVQVAFRQTPESAAMLAPQIGIPARDLVDLPDLHAYVKVAGESTCSVRADAYPPCPPLRAKTPIAKPG